MPAQVMAKVRAVGLSGPTASRPTATRRTRSGRMGGALAVLAAYITCRFMSRPSSTFDFSIASGKEILSSTGGWARGDARIRPADAPDGIQVHNPAFDVTRADLHRGVHHERGVIRPPYREESCPRVTLGHSKLNGRATGGGRRTFSLSVGEGQGEGRAQCGAALTLTLSQRERGRAVPYLRSRMRPARCPRWRWLHRDAAR